MAANSNPHDNTYNSTTFSGPVKAGSRRQPVPTYDRDTVPGTVAVTALPNAGYAICSQSAAIEQTSSSESVNNIVLPSGSMIISIQIIVTTAFDATDDKDLGVCSSPEGDGSVRFLGGYAKLGVVGVYDYADNSNWTTTTFTDYYANRWKDVSYITGVVAGDSVDIRTDAGPGGSQTGRAILTISYIPGLHLLT